ncbi:ATP-binding protein [Nocardioides pacificus]
MAQPNPYTPGQVPRILAGRQAEREMIRDRLGRVATFAEFGGSLLAFHAPRGLGKTSLLRAAQRDADTAGFVSVWVAAAHRGSVLAELVRATERSVSRHDALSGAAATRWRAKLDKIQLEVGLPGAKVSAELSPDRAPAAPSAPIGALEDLLHDTATLVRKSGGAGLLVFVDEIHAASQGDLAVLLNALQNLDGERHANPLAVFAAGLPSTPEALTRAATFGERTAFVPLHRLDAVDSAAAIVEPARALDVSWTDDAIRQVVADTAGYPYFLQLLGSATWDAVRPGAGATIGMADVRTGYPGAAEQLRSLYRARWKAASPAEQDFMAAMATAGVDAVPRAQIATALGKESRALSTPRDRLIEKGIIEPAGHGLVRFTLPGFGVYVAAETSSAPALESTALARAVFPELGPGGRPPGT